MSNAFKSYILAIFFIGLLCIQSGCKSKEKKAMPAYCDAFKKNPNGSWTSIGSTTIEGNNGGPIIINPGVTFSKGVATNGVDLATLLDENCISK